MRRHLSPRIIVFLVCIGLLLISIGAFGLSYLTARAAGPAFNNEGISSHDGSATAANFDGGGFSYSNTALQAAGLTPNTYLYINNAPFHWPQVTEGQPDNWQAAGQTLPVTLGIGVNVSLLGAASGGAASGTATLNYSNGTSQNVSLAFSDWTLSAGRDSLLPGEGEATLTNYRNTSSGGRQNVTTYVFMTTLSIASNKAVISIKLPSSTTGGKLHVFAVESTFEQTPPTITPQPTGTVGLPNLHDDWPTYQGNNSHTGFNSTEAILNASTFPHLHLKWTAHAGTSNGTTGISVQPVEANGIIYWGSWDGVFHATSLSGQTLWTVNLGQTHSINCYPPTVGIADTATVGSVNSTPAVFVGGGNNTFYALNAITGAVIWSTSLTTLNHSPNGDFIWGSVALYNGSLYIGIASFGDCPLVQGQLMQLSVTNGAIQHLFNVVPNGCVGGGISGTPTIDSSTDILYIATGNPGGCSSTEHYGAAIIALNTGDLSMSASWQTPDAFKSDYDFVNTPTLFGATINGTVRQLVGVANKDGIFYTFDRTNIGAGPVWKQQIANTGDCPQCGSGSIAPAAWDGTMLYVAGGNVTINGTGCQGSVDALDPATGNFVWRQCITSGHVLGALSAVSGVVVNTAGTQVVARSTSTGAVLFSYTDTTAGSLFYSAASIANGYLYVGNMDGNLLAFSL